MTTGADMQDGKAILSRPWRVIAQELSQETNSKRFTELAEELSCALEERDWGIKTQDGNAGRLPKRPKTISEKES
jgi:hypothetical protein